MHSIRLIHAGGQFIREMCDPSKVYLGPSRRKLACGAQITSRADDRAICRDESFFRNRQSIEDFSPKRRSRESHAQIDFAQNAQTEHRCLFWRALAVLPFFTSRPILAFEYRPTGARLTQSSHGRPVKNVDWQPPNRDAR
jgi:hypothetical protein